MVFSKGQKVQYNGGECEITAVNEDGTLDLQELVDPTEADGTPKKDASGNAIPKRWYGRIDPAGVSGEAPEAVEA